VKNLKSMFQRPKKFRLVRKNSAQDQIQLESATGCLVRVADYRLSVVRTFTGSRRKVSEFVLAELLENLLAGCSRGEACERMEGWSMGASDYRALNASLHYSLSPVLQSFSGVMKARVESSKHWQERAKKSTRSSNAGGKGRKRCHGRDARQRKGSTPEPYSNDQ
jgi:hypothetical protein